MVKLVGGKKCVCWKEQMRKRRERREGKANVRRQQWENKKDDKEECGNARVCVCVWTAVRSSADRMC